jgi:hypothetical protein
MIPKAFVRIFPLLFFFILSLILIFSWFRYGLIYGGGDVGLQTYNPQRFVENAKFIWWEADAPGFPIPQGLTSVPLQFFLSTLQSVGFTPVMMQATLFFLILFSMGYGMYLFVSRITEERRFYAVLAGVFYMFNPYMMIQVWHRFIHNAFVMVAVLPFIAFSWIFWIRRGRFSYLLIFLLINLVSVYLYGTIAFIVTLWIFLFLITLFEAIFPWKSSKDFIRLGGLFLIGLFFWLAINIWWLVPTFTVGPALFSKQHSSEESLVTLINISRQAILPFSLQMINPFYLFSQKELGSFYQGILVRLLPWFFTLIIMIGLFSGLKRKRIIKWSVIFVIILFLAKGASSPFGSIFILGFNNFFPLGVLRNPFEKVGILLPFIGSILFIFGTKSIESYLRERVGKRSIYAFFLLLTILISVYHWPMLTGQIFGRIDKPAFVKVPESYKKTDNWINSNYAQYAINKPGRILHLPLTRTEAISYNWEYGYNGLEPSSLFFTSAPSISHGFNIKYVDDALTALYRGFLDQSLGVDKLLNIIQSFNVRYIVLHKDIKWEETDFDNPQEIEKKLNQLNFLSRSFEEGDLVVYKIDDLYFQNRIFITDRIDLFMGNNFKNQMTPYILKSNTNSISVLDNLTKGNLDNVNLTVISSTNDYMYRAIPASLSGNLINQIYADNSLVDRWLEPLVSMKAVLRQNGEYQAEQLIDLIIKSTKNIFEMMKSRQISAYTKDLDDIFALNFSGSRLLNYIKQEDLSAIFQVHLKVLKVISGNTNDQEITDLSQKVEQKFIESNLLPKYRNTESEEMEERKVFSFEIPFDSSYSIVLYSPDPKEEINGQIFYINGERKQVSLEKLETGTSIYKQDFKAGNYEIQLPALLSKNLFQKDDVVVINSNSGIIKTGDGSLEFIRYSPVYYQGKFIINRPSFLVFSETYNPGWKLVLKNTNEEFKKTPYLANFYGNGWFIKEPGNYEFTLQFEPQKWVKVGIIIAVFSYLAILGAVVLQKKYE